MKGPKTNVETNETNHKTLSGQMVDIYVPHILRMAMQKPSSTSGKPIPYNKANNLSITVWWTLVCPGCTYRRNYEDGDDSNVDDNDNVSDDCDDMDQNDHGAN